MKVRDILDEATATIVDRASVYGDMHEMFEKTAKIASTILGKEITAHDCSVLMMAIKLARISATRNHKDSYVDLVAYAAFAAELAAPEDRTKADFAEGFSQNVDNLVAKLRINRPEKTAESA